MKFILFDCIRLVEGASNSILIDSQRNKYFSINTHFINILNEAKQNDIEELLGDYSIEKSKIITDFFDNLVDEDFGFFSAKEEEHLFKANEESEDFGFFYGLINTSIIEVKESLLPEIKLALNDLIDLGCRFLEIRCYDLLEPKEISDLLSVFQDSSVSSINLFLPYSSHLNEDEFIDKFLKKNYRVSNLIIYGAPEIKKINTKLYNVTYTKSVVSALNCGLVSDLLFSCDSLFLSEGKTNNTCLNKKISIDREGNIKNCPSMSQSFGNIKDTPLQEALDHPDFKKYWNITKDKIHVCKDCEFRYICTDCRAYVEDPEDIFSKPLKCGYNPYTGEWSEWSTNPLKEKSIAYYGMEQLVKKE